MKRKLLLATAVFLACAGSSGRAQITNPSFTSPATGSYQFVNTGDTSITGWSVLNGSGDVGVETNSIAGVSDGVVSPSITQSLFLQGPASSYIPGNNASYVGVSQEVTLSADTTYTLTVAEAHATNGFNDGGSFALYAFSGTATSGTPLDAMNNTFTNYQGTANSAFSDYAVTFTTGASGVVTIVLDNTGGYATQDNFSTVSLAQDVASTSYTVVTTPAPTLLLHKGATTTLTTTITNTGTGTADTLDYAGLGATSSLGNGLSPSATSGGPLNNGGPSASGSQASNSQTYTATTAGSDTITNTGTTGTNHTLQTAASGSYTGTTINVYSGLSTWAGTGPTGNWGTSPSDPNFTANWVDNSYSSGTTYGGAPGVTSGFTGVDTATFKNVSGQSAVTVNLNGATPNVNSITFNTPSPSATSYTIGGLDDTGTITLSGTTPSINVTAGTHTINDPVILGANTSVNVGSGDQLTLSGVISDPPGDSMTYTGPGTTIVTADNTYTGGTTVSGGTLYVNNTSGSGTGTGAVTVVGGATLAGTGTIKPTISGAGIIMQANSNLTSGGVPPPVTSGAVAGKGLTLDNTVAAGTILDASIGSANLTFSLGAGNNGINVVTNTADTTTGQPQFDFANPNTDSTYMTVLGNTANEVLFATGDTITVNDLTGVNNLQLSIDTPYLLIQAGTTPGLLTDNNLYAGLVTSGGVIGGQVENGYVLNLTVAGTAASENYATRLYLFNGDLEVVPEPGTWAMMLGGLGLLLIIQTRRRRQL